MAKHGKAWQLARDMPTLHKAGPNWTKLWEIQIEDGRTDGQTDGQTQDKCRCWAAPSQLKKIESKTAQKKIRIDQGLWMDYPMCFFWLSNWMSSIWDHSCVSAPVPLGFIGSLNLFGLGLEDFRTKVLEPELDNIHRRNCCHPSDPGCKKERLIDCQRKFRMRPRLKWYDLLCVISNYLQV